MRPLTHLGVGFDSKDFDLCSRNEELYDFLSERGDQILEDGYKKWMGDFYENIPKSTFKELKELRDRFIEKEFHSRRLRMPDIVIEDLQNTIKEIEAAMKNNDFGSINDPEYVKYREEYETKKEEWYNSDTYENLLTEIYSYNEAEYNKILLEDPSK
jgi:hypothetical protein